MTSLLTRLETAERGSRELSTEFLSALGLFVDFKQHGPVWLKNGVPFLDGDASPTEDLQDAVDCKPQGCAWCVQELHDGTGLAWVDNGWDSNRSDHRSWEAEGNTPELAFCAALVRAKEAQ